MLLAACAGSPDGAEDSGTPLDSPEAARGFIEAYLEATHTLDHTNTQDAYRLASRGEVLVEPLIEMLGEERRPAEVYSLARLGCAMIHDGRIDSASADSVRAAVVDAQGQLRGDSPEAQLTRLEVARCHPPAPSTGDAETPATQEEEAPATRDGAPPTG